MSEHKIPCMKSTGTFNFPIMQVFCCLHDARYRPIYDTNIDDARLLSKVACNTYMIYQKTKSVLSVSSRDLVLTHHVQRVQHPQLCPNGGILILAFTPNPEKNDMVPETKNALRAYCHVSANTVNANTSNFSLDWWLAARRNQSDSDQGNLNAAHRPQGWPVELNHKKGAQDAGRADQAA